jgi:hypothetical protein
VYVALRRAGHGFGAPLRLATGRIRSVAVAIGPRGDVLVAWDARGVVRTRFKPAGRRAFGATDTIRSEDAFFAQLHPLVSASGRAIVAWSAQFASEGGSTGPVFYEVAVRPAGAGRFRAAQPLEQTSDEGQPREIRVVDDSTGRAVVAWSGHPDANRRVRAAALDNATLQFGPPQDVSAPGTDAFLTDLAAGPLGSLIVVWDDGIEPPKQVHAAVAPGPGAPFGPPEDVSPAQEAREGRAVFDPRTGIPTVVWSNRPAGSGGPVSGIRTVAQAATRVE